VYCVDILPLNPGFELDIISIAENYSLNEWVAEYKNGNRVLSFGFDSADDLFMFLRYLSESFYDPANVEVTRFYFDTDS
jgi:hypothetical protein